MIKRILTLVFILGALALGFLVAKNYYQPAPQKVEKDASVLLEKIETVAKLVTVEGHFSELYNHKEYWRYDWPIFRKRAILRVQAKVSVGYDLSNMAVDIDQDNQVVTISNIPEKPEIISIDHDLDYYDIRQGTFNSFTETDYNDLMDDAKGLIRKKALESSLMQSAEEQGIELIELIRFLVESAGYEVQFDTKNEKLLRRDTMKLID
ncbi:MAG TPA: DUF4230 domain-containing protein [Saprospiraceae bacterium]|nr:DUF4230 domain-containing protein [Saprospiraceae bacterium]